MKREIKMSKKYLVLFLGVLFLAPFEGKAIEYKCYYNGAFVGAINEKAGWNIADLCHDRFSRDCPKVTKESTLKGCTSKK